MKKFAGYDETQTFGDYEKLPAGGYKCYIKQAKVEKWNNGNGESLVLCIDIKEGDHKDFYKKNFESQTNDKKWKGVARIGIPVDSSSDGMKKAFKGFVTSLENSNKGFTFPWDKSDEDTCKMLKDKLIGFVFGEEEYKKQNGDIGVAVKPMWPRSYDKVLEAPVPERKKLQTSSTNSSSWDPSAQPSTEDEELPF